MEEFTFVMALTQPCVNGLLLVHNLEFMVCSDNTIIYIQPC